MKAPLLDAACLAAGVVSRMIALRAYPYHSGHSVAWRETLNAIVFGGLMICLFIAFYPR